MNARRLMVLLGLAGLTLLATPESNGQEISGGGHALDANLRLGSGGYNGGGGRGMVGHRGGGRRIDDTFDVGGGPSVRGSGSFVAGSRYYSAARPTVDEYNAFQRQRGYSTRRWDRSSAAARPHEGEWGGATPAGSGSGAVRSASGFDAGYQAGLASAKYESERAQHQMRVISYGVGFAIGEEVRAALTEDGLALDDTELAAAFRNGILGEASRLPRDQIEAILASVQQRVAAAVAERMLATDPDFTALHDRNGERSAELRQQLGADPDVLTLPGGIQYKVLRAGEGAAPVVTDTVIADYALLAPDGSVLVEGSGEEVDIDETVEGIREVLLRMSTNARWRVFIPSELAYGAAGRAPHIGPNQSVYIEIDLREIRRPPSDK